MYRLIRQQFGLFLILSILSAGVVDADSFNIPGNATMQAIQSSTSARPQKQISKTSKIPCTCRFQGRSHELGTVACIKTAKGKPVQAHCQMSLNNTTWKFSDTPCNPDEPTS